MDLRAYLLDALGDLRSRVFTAVVERVPAERWTEQADGGGSSIAWLLLHMARHQDLAIATAIRDQPPLFLAEREKLGLGDAPPSAGLTEKEDRATSAAPPPDALTSYLTGVFAATQRWLERLSAMAMDTVPNTPRRFEARADLAQSDVPWLYEMWTGKTVNWFVQWPVLGHGNAHVGEMIAVRNRMGLSPF